MGDKYVLGKLIDGKNPKDFVNNYVGIMIPEQAWQDWTVDDIIERLFRPAITAMQFKQKQKGGE